ncbi:MAG TPA: outer membrane beta-barrel protein [Longimicrobium sp.]
MPTLMFGRARAVVMGMLVLAAAAPAAQGQSHPRWQVEASLHQTGATSMHGVIADGPSSSYDVRQVETVRYSVGASALARVAPRSSLRFGLSLSNKGFAERSTVSSPTGDQTTVNQVDLLYLGAPLTLGYNLVNPRRGLVPVAEAGVVAEVLLREDESVFDYDLRDTGLSYLFNAGVKYTLADGRALVLAPELRIAAHPYSRDAPGAREFRPVTVGLKLAVQF